jgi:hypothetical protein
MNIFAVSIIPSECAAALDDKRVIKMALETAQILCTVLAKAGYTATPYKPTHHNHPCTKWTGETLANWEWLRDYLEALNNEYRLRFQRNCDMQPYRVIIDNNLSSVAQELLPHGELSEFFNCSGFPELQVHLAYRECLKQKWLNYKHAPRWTNSAAPLWKCDP